MITVNRIEDFIQVSSVNFEKSCKYDPNLLCDLTEIANRSDEISSMDELSRLIGDVEDAIKRYEKSEDFIDTNLAQFVKNPKTGKLHMKVEDTVSPIEIPASFEERLNVSFEKGIDVQPLVKCWLRFLRNPKIENADFRERFFKYINMTYVHPKIKSEKLKEGYSEELASQFATVYQVKITKEGLLNCFKVSSEVDWKYEADEDGNPKKVNRYVRSFDVNTGEITGDSRDDLKAEDRLFEPAIMGKEGDAFYCGATKGHFIKVGQVHYLESEDMVNDNDNESCVKGLHVGRSAA